MTTQQNVGPAELRRLATQAREWPNTNIADYLDILAAAWDADRAALAASRENHIDANKRNMTANERADRAEAALERLTAAASGRGMVSEMDGLPEIAVLVVGLHERAERAEAVLERAANDLMLSEESFVQMRAKRDNVLRELQTTRAALEIAQAKADVIGGEMCSEARAAGRGPCGSCAWCVKNAESERDAFRLSVYELREQLRHSVSEISLADAQDELAATRAALERARALLVKLRDGIDDYWGFCNPEIIAELAALLAPASGGAA